MRLTNINCPQCNGQLNQQEDKFYCTSCGSAFNIDYEESDVEYAKLITEPERTRLHLESNRVLLEKNEELRNKFITGERKKEFVHQVKSQGITYLGGAVYGIIIGGISFVMTVGIIAIIFFNVWKSAEKNSKEREQARQESIENLSARDIEKDKNFIENAIAAGISYELYWRDEPVENDIDDGGDAYIVGKPVPVNCYLIKTGSENDLCIVYKITYEFSESGSIKDVYDCVIFAELEQDESGHISFERSPDRVYGREIDDDWDGYENADDVYEDDTFPKKYKLYEIDI